MNAMELKRGFHLAVEDSRIIPTGNGVFIEYDGFLSKKMEGLRALLIQCYPDAATRFPEAFAHRYSQDEIAEHSRRLREQRAEKTGFREPC